MLSVTQNGGLSKTNRFLKGMKDAQVDRVLNHFGQLGVRSLSANTPVDTGLTASSWDYVIEKSNGKLTLSWINRNVNRGVNIAVIIQTGHGTRNGGYVVGRDYINPSLRPLFDQMSKDIYKAVMAI